MGADVVAPTNDLAASGTTHFFLQQGGVGVHRMVGAGFCLVPGERGGRGRDGRGGSGGGYVPRLERGHAGGSSCRKQLSVWMQTKRLQVEVGIINSPTKAGSVNVTPVSEDDWEILVS